MKKLLLILLCLPMIGLGQGWERILNDGIGWHTIEVSDGFLVSSYYGGSNIIKTDNNGIVQWSKLLCDDCFSNSFIDLNDKYLISYNRNINDSNATLDLVLLNNQADTLIIKSDFLSNVPQGFDENLSMAFDSTILLMGDHRMYRLNQNLDSLFSFNWNSVLDFDTDDGGSYSICQTNDSSIVISGGGQWIGGPSTFICKTDYYGALIYNHTYNDEIIKLIQTSDDGYAAIFLNSSEFSILKKFDSNGLLQWQHLYDHKPSPFFLMDLVQTEDGEFVLTGGLGTHPLDISYVGVPNLHVIKTDLYGDTLWAKTYGSVNSDYGFDIIECSDNSYLITGVVNLTNQSGAVYLIKIGADGNVSFNNETFFSTTNKKIDKTIDILGREILPKTNTPFIEMYDDGTVEKKVIIEY